MKSLWLRSIFLLSFLSFALFAYGFVNGVQDVLYPQPSETRELIGEEDKKKQPDSVLDIVFLGDSLTRGIGDKEGLGYAGRIKNSLVTEVDTKVTSTNLAVSGATSDDLIQQLETEGVKYSLSQAEMIILTIGGNDLHPDWQDFESTDFSTYRGDVSTFTHNAEKILDQLRSINSDSSIYWIGLYNPFENLAGLESSPQIVQNWNNSLEEVILTYDDVYMIPVFDLFQGQTDHLLYTDHFHPNHSGYELIADRVMQKIVSEWKFKRQKEETE